MPPWALMWLLAFAIYASFKFLTCVTCKTHAPLWKRLGYLLLWPGMNPREFYTGVPATTTFREWSLAVFKPLLGVCLLLITPQLQKPLLAGWVGMIGLLFTLHFGLFHLLSLGWRSLGVNAVPLMNWPVLSSCLSDFWGRRWNLAFRDLAFVCVFRPLASRIGVTWATMTVFFLSGIVHDLVISVPTGGGYGGPTLYFLLQGCGLLADRAVGGGRALLFAVVVLPVTFLFHHSFINQAILPTLQAMGLRICCLH